MYDWSKFIKRIPVNSDIKTLYRAIATQQGLERWFLRTAEFTKADGTRRDKTEFIEKGDSYLWMWHGWPDSVFEKNDILEANGSDQLVFHFAEVCKVGILLKQAAQQCIAELTQSEIPVDEEHRVKWHLGCMEGWTFYLANLKSIIENSYDLRNRSLDLGTVVNS